VRERDLQQGFTVATDTVVAACIAAASRRLVVVAPALFVEVAEAVCDRWRTLGVEAVTVVLDSDPEVYRLGYGDAAALDKLQQAANEVGGTLRHQPGLRIAVVIADEQTIVYAPTPRSVEAGQNTQGAANALCLGRPPDAVTNALGLGATTDPQIGRGPLDAQRINQIKNDLTANPPQKFDLARKVRVFNAFIEFVELKVIGTQVSRRTVPIPNHLLALADATTREQLRASFRLVPRGDALSGKTIDRDRNLLVGPFLREIPNYGTVVLRTEKEDLERGVEALIAAVNAFREKVRADLEAVIERNCSQLMTTFMPALQKNPPAEWIPSTGQPPDVNTLRRYLERDLKRAFGSADSLVGAMKVQCRFKGVTYESLSDKGFIDAATKAIPELQRFHEEFLAAEASANEGTSAPQRTSPPER
jgi:hypothetical protein